MNGSDLAPFESYDTAPAIEERRRLRTLGALHMLHSAPEERFDRITRLARELFDVPFAFVNLVAEHYHWCKSQAGGAGINIVAREDSLCAYAIREHDTLVIWDLAGDDRFAENPLVTGAPSIRFYAGRPLRAANGHTLGTLCIMDREPRFMSDHELTLLDDLGVLVERELETAHTATIDVLTGVTNRQGFMQFGPSLLENCRLNRHHATLVSFDLVGIEQINLRVGHSTGDVLLRQFARLVQTVIRKSDLFARLQDDEFALLAAGARTAGAEALLTRIDAAILDFQKKSDAVYRLQYRYGLFTIGPTDTASLNELLAEAAVDRKSRRLTEERS